jgi:hypothetical protein
MQPTIMPVLDWNPLDTTWEEYRNASINLETKKIVAYRTAKSTSKIIMWDDWSFSFKDLLERAIKNNGFPLAVGKSEDPVKPPDEFFIINNDTDALMAILTFQ